MSNSDKEFEEVYKKYEAQVEQPCLDRFIFDYLYPYKERYNLLVNKYCKQAEKYEKLTDKLISHKERCEELEVRNKGLLKQYTDGTYEIQPLEAQLEVLTKCDDRCVDGVIKIGARRWGCMGCGNRKRIKEVKS